MSLECIKAEQLPDVFAGAARIFADKKEELCEMDARMGDGDLGLTMQKGYGALPELLKENMQPDDPAKTLMKAGMKMSSVVPSTMGTLMASGIMEGGKALKGKTEIGSAELADFLEGFAGGIQKRGKCEPGDRTILDAMKPAAEAGRREAEAGGSLQAVLDAAVRGAEEGVHATESMIPKFGKAAVHAAKAQGVPDQGAVAGKYLLEGLREGVSAVRQLLTTKEKATR